MQDALTVIPGRGSDELSIVGFADGHRDLAPAEGDIWGLNRLWAVMERPWTAWFDIHDLDGLYGDGAGGIRDEDHIGFLSKFKGPVFLRPQDVALAKTWGIKHATPYPIRAVLRTFPRYFTNSISYMIALAVLMDYQRLGVFGVDMAQDSLMQAEYSHQRPGCEFHLGVAMAKGIEVHLPPGSDLLRASHMYGFEDDTGIRAKDRARLQELGGRKEQLKRQMAALEQQQALQNQAWENDKRNLFAGINQLDGAMQQVSYAMRQLSPEPVKDDEDGE